MASRRGGAFGREFAVYAGGLALAHGISAVSALIFVNLLTPADYGTLAAVTSLAAWAVALASWGAGETFGRFLGLAAADKRRPLVGAWLALLLGSLALLLAPALPAAGWLAGILLASGALALPLSLALVAQALGCLNEQLALLLRFAFRPFAFAGAQVFAAAGIAGVALALLLLDFGLVGVLWAYLASGLGTLALLLALARKTVSFRADPATLGALARYGLPLVPAALLWLGLGAADRLLLLNVSANEAGLYATAAKLALVAGLVSTAFELGWSPRALALLRDDPAAAPERFGQALHAFLFVMAAAGGLLAAAAPDLLRLLTPAAYWPAAALVGLLVAGLAADGATYIFRLPLAQAGRSPAMLLPPAIGLSVNLALNLVLIPRAGALGAALAFAASYLVIAAVYLRLMRRHLALAWTPGLVACGALLALLAVAGQLDAWRWPALAAYLACLWVGRPRWLPALLAAEARRLVSR